MRTRADEAVRCTGIAALVAESLLNQPRRGSVHSQEPVNSSRSCAVALVSSRGPVPFVAVSATGSDATTAGGSAVRTRGPASFIPGTFKRRQSYSCSTPSTSSPGCVWIRPGARFPANARVSVRARFTRAPAVYPGQSMSSSPRLSLMSGSASAFGGVVRSWPSGGLPGPPWCTPGGRHVLRHPGPSDPSAHRGLEDGYPSAPAVGSWGSPVGLAC